MLRLTGLSLARGARVLYRDVSVLAAPGERIGLVGANGCGKSSLMAAILGELGAEAGDIQAPAAARIAHVAQDIDAGDGSALDYVLEGHLPLVLARRAVAESERASDEMLAAHAHAQLADVDPGAVAAQALTVMRGLGFDADAGTRPMRSYSGGWRNRLALARALLRPADLLLLDEPTNHLDIDSVIWLEAWLRRQSATVLIISHDREFLDRCAETIWHVDAGSLTRYSGNYSRFEEALVERRRQQDTQAQKYQRTAAHLQAFVDRFRAKATKARQAQSRLKILQRLVAIEPSRAQHEWRFEFLEPRALPDRLVDASDLELAYGDTVVLRGVRAVIDAGDRIGILGVNGAGKSTLVKALTGTLAPRAGRVQRANGAAIGYFAQHQLDQLVQEQSPLEQLRSIAPQVREQELRDFLGGFKFSGELATAPVGRMSGGEKARCALALIAWQRPNLLVLDEPTNHLDMDAREALTVALSEFDGALLLVSHDRYLLRAATDQLWLVHDGVVGAFDGDLDEYAALVLASRRERAEAPALERQGAPDRRGERRRQAQERERLVQRRRPLEKQVQRIEADMSRTGVALRELDARLADPLFYNQGDSAAVSETLRERTRIANELGRLEEAWLKTQGELEAIG